MMAGRNDPPFGDFEAGYPGGWSVKKSAENFFSCVREHPAMANKSGHGTTILIGSDKSQKSMAKSIIRYCPKDLGYSFIYVDLESENSERVGSAIDECAMFIFIYDSSMRADISPHGPSFIHPLKPKMAEHWKKSVLLREYGEFFEEAFSEDINDISDRNGRIIDAATSAQHVTFRDGFGGTLCGTLSGDQAWKSLDGRNHYDLMPGEVATRIVDLSGSVTFGGTFLSTVPFAIKYGVIDSIMKIKFDKSQVIDVSSSNRQLENDFKLYLKKCPGNKIVEEFGIGTNLNVKLHGRNASFEERHPGLHLGLGGGERGSHHLDLVFSSGTILFDDVVIFDKSFRV